MEESIHHFIHNEVNNKLHLLHRTTPNYFTKLQQTSFTLLNYIISHLHQTTPYPTFTKLHHTTPHQTTLHDTTPITPTSPNYNTLHQTTPPLPNYTALLYTELHRITTSFTKLFSCFLNFPRASNLNECSLSHEIIVKCVVCLY